MFPAPPPLSREEFAKRRAQLIAEGKPLTTRNIDPALAEWADRNAIHPLMWMGVISGGIILFVLIAYCVTL